MSRNLEIAKQYIAAVEAGATGEALAAFFAEDVVQEEFPNRFFPEGARRDLGAILEGAERGQKVMAAQKYEILNAVAGGDEGDQVALELRWTGTTAIALGPIPAGHELRARIAIFLEFRGGKIWRQRNYDCYEAG